MEYPTVCLASAVRWHEKVGAVFRMVASTLSLKALALLVYVLGFVATLNRKRQGCEGIDSRLFTSSAKLTWFHVRFRVFVLFCFSFFFFRFRCCHRLSFFSFFSFFFSCAAVRPPPTFNPTSGCEGYPAARGRRGQRRLFLLPGRGERLRVEPRL